MNKELTSLLEMETGAHQEVGVGKLTLPARTELIVQLPVSVGSRIGDGLVERAEITSGVYMAKSLIKVSNGHITSIVNTTEQDAQVPNPVVKVSELTDHDVGETAVIGEAKWEKGRDGPGQSRGKEL